jgi:hypothetical protein
MKTLKVSTLGIISIITLSNLSYCSIGDRNQMYQANNYPYPTGYIPTNQNPIFYQNQYEMDQENLKNKQLKNKQLQQDITFQEDTTCARKACIYLIDIRIGVGIIFMILWIVLMIKGCGSQ